MFLKGEHLAVGVLQHLVCQIDVPQGRHLYADPAPQGMIPFTLTLDAQSKLVIRELIRPASEAHTMASTGEIIQVNHGRVELRLPITANGAITSTTVPTMLDLSGEVSWQTCDEDVCDVPRRSRFEFSVPIEGAVVPEFMTKPGNPKVRAMDGMKHFKKMSSRRQS
ncbi:MAG: protein-disulfide reductase DsbD family protein [Pseudomonadales bacterium]|nr:protein-disulfide reductase DsbD family protein [Pseudomonadales bacterium]MDG1443063.1 protein-disulfide reductase DsbD family protein [Pseudomonadales bacterium]